MNDPSDDVVIRATELRKHFRIPSAKRSTVREHFFGLLTPRRFERLDVLSGVSFEIRRGETVGIIGRNGCGKSTLLKILAGIYLPNGGAVELNAGITPILELGLGFNPLLNARENIYLAGTAMGLTLAHLDAELEHILEFAELTRFADLELKHYSSGMCARLAYSVAFRAVRDVLLLDEIFAVGDAGFTRRCEDRYRELNEAGHTIILVSHAEATITDFCKRAILIEKGVVLADGPAKEVSAMYEALLSK